MKLKIVFFGTPNFVVPVLDVLQKNFDLVGVVTTPDAPTGRKKILAGIFGISGDRAFAV